MIALKPLILSGREVWPLIEGGKGISISNGLSSGAWAATGGIGTFSGVNGDYIDERGRLVPLVYRGRTRLERHEELISYSIKAAISQARIAHDVRGGDGRLHMNVLWEMASCERVLNGVLEGARGLVHGITCGAGMPYRLAEIAAKYNVYYYPIVSSARAFRALWKRAYHRLSDWLGGVVYEDPWRAGGHNGLSNSEDPEAPEAPYPRVQRAARHDARRRARRHRDHHGRRRLASARVAGLARQPRARPGRLPVRHPAAADPGEPDLGRLEAAPARARGGRRPAPALQPDRVLLLGGQERVPARAEGRSQRQIAFAAAPDAERGLTEPLAFGTRGRWLYVRPEDLARVEAWIAEGYSQAMKTPGRHADLRQPRERDRDPPRPDQLHGLPVGLQVQQLGVQRGATPPASRPIRARSASRRRCTRSPTARDVRTQLMFAGHNVYKFRDDPFYSNGFIPTVRQLVERIATGD